MKVVEKKPRGEGIEEAGETEGARRATGVFPAGAPAAERPRRATPEVEVVAKAERRRFTAEYKRRIVREADRCTTPGEIGALLRREGLYSSLLTTWRAARDRGELEGLAPKKRGPKVDAARSAGQEDRRAGARDRSLEQARRASRGAGGCPKKSRGAAGDPVREREVTIETVREMGPRLGIAPTVRGSGPADGDLLPTDRARSRPAERRPSPPRTLAGCRTHGRARGAARARVRRSARPAQVYAQLLDAERYLCSERTMYRILAENHEVRERRDQLRHPPLRGARAPGHRAQSGLELGHHQAARAGEVDLLLSLRDPGHLQPLRRRLDGRAPRERGAGEEADRADLPRARGSPRASSRSMPTAGRR